MARAPRLPSRHSRQASPRRSPPRFPAQLARHAHARRLDPHRRQRHLTVFTGKAELGQGIKTALLQIAAEELGVDPSDPPHHGRHGRTPNEGYTAGSHSMQTAAPPSAMRRRRRASCCLRPPPPRWRADAAHCADARRHGHPRPTAAARLRRGSSAGWTCTVRAAAAVQRSKRPRSIQRHRPAAPARRHPGQGDRRRQPTCRTCACPAWCMRASCARRAMARR